MKYFSVYLFFMLNIESFFSPFRCGESEVCPCLFDVLAIYADFTGVSDTL